MLQRQAILHYTVYREANKVSAFIKRSNFLLPGSIVAKPPNVSKQIYYYAMVLPGCENYTAIPVAEFISSEHKTVFINFFLSLFRDNMNRITSRHPVIDKIETDFSLALIQSALQTFNGMSISEYMQFVYNWNSKKEGADDIHLTVVHICATHTLRTVMKKAKSLFKLKSARNVAAFLIYIEINSLRQLICRKCIFRNAVVIFGLEKKTKDFDKQLNYCTSLHIEDENENIHEEELSDDDEKFSETAKRQRRESPYYEAFHDIISSTRASKTNIGKKINEFYSEELILNLDEYIMPYFPIWSAVTLRQFGLSRDSNACVENWFKVVKADIFQTKLHVPATRFIQKMETYLVGRLREREYTLKTNRQMKNKLITATNKQIKKKLNRAYREETAEEFWNKKKKRKEILIFKCQKSNRQSKNQRRRKSLT